MAGTCPRPQSIVAAMCMPSPQARNAGKAADGSSSPTHPQWGGMIAPCSLPHAHTLCFALE
eukprot:352986-Chlamydomonas_euryale.AAC.8